MPLRVTVHTVSLGADHTSGSFVLAESPEAPPGRPVHFGRKSEKLLAEVGAGPVLEVAPTLDRLLSRVQGTVQWLEGAVWITNKSEGNRMSVRQWGFRPLVLPAGQDAYLQLASGRAIVEVVGTSTYLVVGPDEPYEAGWSVPPESLDIGFTADDDNTPAPLSVRDLVRPAVLCGCRLEAGVCSLGHDHDLSERRLQVSLAGALPLTVWPPTIDDDLTTPSQKAIAEMLGIAAPTLTKDAKAFGEQIGESFRLPPKDATDRFQWLLEQGVLDFDDVSDLVKSLS